MAKKSKRSDNLIALQCAVCKRRNYYTGRNKKTAERKIEFKKYCKWCKKHEPHKETKISAKAKTKAQPKAETKPRAKPSATPKQKTKAKSKPKGKK